MGNLAVSGLGRPGDSVNDCAGQAASSALHCSSGRAPAERAGFAVFIQQRVLARTGSGKLTVFFDEDFDGNPSKSNGEQRNSKEDDFPFHAAKLRGS